jgi:hypothetical protein
MTKWQAVMMTALLASPMAGCGKPQAVTALKTGITALKEAAAKDVSEGGYHTLVTGTEGQFATARPQLSAGAAAACRQALDRAADVDLAWRDTDGIADGLTPVAEEPLTRLKVVKTHKDFQKWESGFIPWEQSEEDTPDEEAYKAKVRDGGRHDLIKAAMDGAAPALEACEDAL